MHSVVKYYAWDVIAGAQAVNFFSFFFFTPIPTAKDESEYKKRGQSKRSISCCHLLCAALPNFLWPEAMCWPGGQKKKKFCLNGNAGNQFHTSAHRHTSKQIKSFDSWLYTPFVQPIFVSGFCVCPRSHVVLSAARSRSGERPANATCSTPNKLESRVSRNNQARGFLRLSGV